MSSNITRLESKRGGQIVIIDNYIYNFPSIVPESARKRFRCSIRSCLGSVVLYNNIPTLFTVYNHELMQARLRKNF